MKQRGMKEGGMTDGGMKERGMTEGGMKKRGMTEGAMTLYHVITTSIMLITADVQQEFVQM